MVWLRRPSGIERRLTRQMVLDVSCLARNVENRNPSDAASYLGITGTSVQYAASNWSPEKVNFLLVYLPGN
jgi:hypothetical protein